MFHFLHYFLQDSRKTYGKYRKSTEGKNNMGTDREIMHLCQVNKIGQYFRKHKKLPSMQRVNESKDPDDSNSFHAAEKLINPLLHILFLDQDIIFYF